MYTHYLIYLIRLKSAHLWGEKEKGGKGSDVTKDNKHVRWLLE